MKKNRALFFICLGLLISSFFNSITPVSASNGIIATRTISNPELYPGDSFNVTTEIVACQELISLSICENYPKEWMISPIENNGSAFNVSSCEWRWMDPVYEDEKKSLVYKVTIPNDTPGGSYRLDGNISYIFENDSISDLLSSCVQLSDVLNISDTSLKSSVYCQEQNSNTSIASSDASSLILSSSILPAISIEVTPGSVEFGRLSAGRSSDQNLLSVRNKGSLSARVTTDVIDTANDLYVNGLYINSAGWKNYSTLVRPGKSVNNKVMLSVPDDYIGLGSVEGKIVFWAEIGDNMAPILEPIGDRTLNSSEVLNIVLLAYDPDGDDLTYSTDAQFGNLDENVFVWDTSGASSGEYEITFSVSDGYCIDSQSIVITLNGQDSDNSSYLLPEAEFTSDANSGKVPLTVSFTDLSLNASFWKWDFGDGTFSENKDPVHEYLLPGIYTVNLTAGNNFGNDREVKDDYITVLPAIIITLDSPSSSSVTDNVGNSRQFIVSTDETANITWLLDGINLHTNYSVTNASCYFSSAEEGVHDLIVFAENTNGTAQDGWVWTVTNSSSSSSSSNSSSSSSGRRVYGSSYSGESYDNILAKESRIQNIVAKKRITYSFYNNDIPVTSLSFTALKNSGIVSATVELLEHRSVSVTSSPSGVLYRYINIWVGETGFASSDNIENAVVTFKVNKSWVADNDIDEASISLYRYSDEWDRLPTSKIKEDDAYLYYKANTPGFSPFAITGNEITHNSVASAESVLGSTRDEVSSETSFEGNLSVKEAGEPIKGLNGWISFLAGISVVCLLVVCLIAKKDVLFGNSNQSYNVILTETLTRDVLSDTIVSYDLGDKVAPVRYISFESTVDAGPLELKVEILRGRSAFVRNMPNGIVYKNFNIWSGDVALISSSRISNIVIGFQVERLWIEENGVDEQGITMMRYAEDTWHPLETRITDQNSIYVEFESYAPGFSSFAISGQGTVRSANTGSMKNRGLLMLADRCGSWIKDSLTNIKSGKYFFKNMLSVIRIKYRSK